LLWADLSLVGNSFTYTQSYEYLSAAKVPDSYTLMLRRTINEGSYCIHTIETNGGC
jgi:hypothetical protein